MISKEERAKRRSITDRKRRANFTPEQRAKYAAYDKEYGQRRKERSRQERLKKEDLEREVLLDKLDARLQQAFTDEQLKLLDLRKRARKLIGPKLELYSPLFSRKF